MAASTLAGRVPGPTRLTLLAALACIAALLVGPAIAAAHDVGQSAEEVLSYWTDERMAAAQPGELLATGGPASGGGARSAADGSRFAVAEPGAPGNRTHGKVYLTIPDEGDFVCSGTVTESFSRSLVTSAGHCVSDQRTFASNWMFVPAYDSGASPYGRWTATELNTTEGWKADDDLRFDVGMAIVGENSQGQPIEDVVGAREIAFNQPRDQFYTAYGYPADQPPFEFNGEREFACTSSWRGDDRSFSAPRPMQIACDMTSGSSGGGWVARNTLLSVNSFKAGLILVPDNRFMYGPYFGDAVAELYRKMGGGPALCAQHEAELAAARKAYARARAALAKARARKRAADGARARRRAAARVERRLDALADARAAKAQAKQRYEACVAGQLG